MRQRKIFDSHIHLDQYSPDQLDQLIVQWMEAGVFGVLAVSTDLASSYRTLELKQKYPDFVHAAIGIHPEEPLPNEQDRMEWRSLLSTERKWICAIGEVGLPHYSNNPKVIEHFDSYVQFLVELSQLSNRYHLPLILHAVHDKAEIALQILKKEAVSKAQFHWLKAPSDVVSEIINSGYYISITPEVYYRERDQLLADSIPLSKLLLETDGPWPYDYWSEYSQTTPLLINKSAEKIAEIKKLSTDDILRQSLINTLTFLD